MKGSDYINYTGIFVSLKQHSNVRYVLELLDAMLNYAAAGWLHVVLSSPSLRQNLRFF